MYLACGLSHLAIHDAERLTGCAEARGLEVKVDVVLGAVLGAVDNVQRQQRRVRDRRGGSDTKAEIVADEEYQALEKSRGPAVGLAFDRRNILQKPHHQARLIIKIPTRANPARKAPPEVLAMIFELCLDPFSLNDVPNKKETRSRQSQPFYLASVCRQWRHASLTSARAWSVVEFSFDTLSSVKKSLWSRYLSLVLDRSGQTELSLRILYTKRSCVYHKTFLDALTKRALPRCTQLFIHVKDLDDEDDAKVRWLQSHMPKLREMHIRGMDYDSETPPRYIPNAPLLRALASDGKFSDSWDMSTLSSATLHEPSLAIVAEFCKAAPRIPNLSLVSLCCHDATPAFFESVVSLSITHLAADHYFDPTIVADYLTFPNVREVHLRGETKSATRLIAYLSRSIGKSHMPLIEHLSILAPSSSCIALLLSAIFPCATLRRIEFEGSKFIDKDVECLRKMLGSPDKNGNWGCTSLRDVVLSPSCEIVDSRLSRATITALIAARKLSSRLGTVSMLQTFALPPSSSADLLESVQAALT